MDNIESVETELDSNVLMQTNLSNGYLNREIWTLIKEIADTIQISEALPSSLKNSKSNIVLTLLTGKEMGMTPMRAIQGLYIVNGKINIYGAETVRRLREHGYTIEYFNENDEQCSARVFKKGDNGEVLEEYKETFKFIDAVTSGWTGKIIDGKDDKGNPILSGTLKAGWLKGQNRKLKMRYGALSAIIKSYIPEVMGSGNDIAEIAEDFSTNDVQEEVQNSSKEERANTLQQKLKAAKNIDVDEAEVVAQPNLEKEELT